MHRGVIADEGIAAAAWFEGLFGALVSQAVNAAAADFEDEVMRQRDALIAGEIEELPAPPWLARGQESGVSHAESPTAGGITGENRAGTAEG